MHKIKVLNFTNSLCLITRPYMPLNKALNRIHRLKHNGKDMRVRVQRRKKHQNWLE